MMQAIVSLSVVMLLFVTGLLMIYFDTFPWLGWTLMTPVPLLFLLGLVFSFIHKSKIRRTKSRLLYLVSKQ